MSADLTMTTWEFAAVVAAVVFGIRVIVWVATFGNRWDRAEATIIALLASRPHMTGLEIVRASNGQLSRGSVYVYLGLMEENGLVTSSTGAGGMPRRRLYTLTEYGHRKATTND
jgi:DNA-binding PadR family transcriptional regulator